MDLYILLESDKVVYWTSSLHDAKRWEKEELARAFRKAPQLPIGTTLFQ